jgi:hypothetical protein
VLAFLDLNGDGKLDDKDIDVDRSNIRNLMDINGNGEVNLKDALLVFSTVLLARSLAAQPACAKGGGGGHGGSSDLPAYKCHLRGRNIMYNRPFDIKACSNLPGEGELVDMLVSRILTHLKPFSILS